MVQDENVKIARLDMVTVQRRPIPRPLPRVELRRHIVVAPDLDAVIIEKYPAFYPRPVFRGGLHYAERRVLWRAFGGARSVEPRF